jgi:putative acetyltransferase
LARVDRLTTLDGVEIRRETTADIADVFAVEAAAFGRPDEARIVDAIRGTPDEIASWVATYSGRVVAHVLFSRVRIDGTSAADAVALGPVAVTPQRQGVGIGDALIRRGIEILGQQFDWLFVLGNPRYYGRFGFSLARTTGFEYQTPGFERAFQVMPLRRAVAGGGRVTYHTAFG